MSKLMPRTGTASMPKPQILKTETGEELVVITRSEYEELIAAAADDAAEDAALVRLAAEREDELGLPEEIWEAIEAAPSPVGPLRKWRCLTQSGLAKRAEITQGYLSEIEAGKKTGDVSTLRAIARALDVPLESVMPEEEEPKTRKASGGMRLSGDAAPPKTTAARLASGVFAGDKRRGGGSGKTIRKKTG